MSAPGRPKGEFRSAQHEGTSVSLIDVLGAAVGSANVLTSGDLTAWEQDWRRRWRGKALAVVRPASTQEVAAVVRACASHGVSIVPQGGNTGLVGGGVPDDTGNQVLLSLQRMNKLRRLDVANLTLTAEAGCVLQNVQAAAAEQGLLFPLSLAAQGSCTLGGNLATNAGGTQVLRWGNTRELCLGLEVVTAQGEVKVGVGRYGEDHWRVEIVDTGIGIPADQQQRVFEPFVQLQDPSPERSPGQGLGLAIVRRAVDLLGHPLVLRSVPGRGSCFSIGLPLAGGDLGARPGPVAHS